jgi:hypothetical protein
MDNFTIYRSKHEIISKQQVFVGNIDYNCEWHPDHYQRKMASQEQNFGLGRAEYS